MHERLDHTYQEFLAVWNVLTKHVGPGQAISQHDLAIEAGLWSGREDQPEPDVRKVQIILQERRDDFPLPVLSSGRGMFLVTSADEANAYFKSMLSRHQQMTITMKAVRKKMIDAGFIKTGPWSFRNPPDKQVEIPMVLS